MPATTRCVCTDVVENNQLWDVDRRVRRLRCSCALSSSEVPQRLARFDVTPQPQNNPQNIAQTPFAPQLVTYVGIELSCLLFWPSTAMGANVVSSWEQVIKLLRKGTKDPASCADSSVQSEVVSLITKLTSSPPPPRSVWKKLVQQQQVRWCSSCCHTEPPCCGSNSCAIEIKRLTSSTGSM